MRFWLFTTCCSGGTQKIYSGFTIDQALYVRGGTKMNFASLFGFWFATLTWKGAAFQKW